MNGARQHFEGLKDQIASGELVMGGMCPLSSFTVS